ncbi:hypothetical protein [Psychroserpens ponticola]|uniref:T9SS C-terminal target domain-containing protein n=1 Tax=Psychroserpens ponticola TaxID=2932268 RepID=A0ABY7RVX5_9FLAO|nr:hypothetical protein [Psychroserpens ponticola]WCO00846.1 hypothetical protein MUN68_012305 [Psychroserpens ponticola]
MKFKLILLITLFSLTNLHAQTNKINYKALIKDATGNVLTNTSIDIEFSILATANQIAVYKETHTSTTDNNGLVILNIGQGITTDVFTDIEWEQYDHYLNVVINTGSGYTDMGTTEFMAVPYALHTENANFSKESETANNLILKHGNTSEFALSYDSTDDKLRITENGVSGSVLEINNGDLYLPQYAGNNNGSLKVDATGKVISETIPQTITFNRFEFPISDVNTGYTRLRKGVQFPDGTVLTGITALLKDNNTSGSNSVSNTIYAGLYRVNKYTFTEATLLPIYRIDGTDTSSGTFSQFTTSSVIQTNANIIDNANYIYLIQVWSCDDCELSEFSIMKN